MKLAIEETIYYVKYLRVSTDEQREGISIDFQGDKIDEWIERQAGTWVCVGTFQENFTGFEYERPEMDILWELAKQHKINAVVVLRRNRFARGEAASMILEQHFYKNNVRLFSVEQGEFTPGKNNRILSAVERAQSEDEAESIKKNMREKRYAYIEKNGAFQSQGKAKYGYDKVGKKDATRLVINNEQAEVVRWIMELFIARKTYNEIADILNDAGILRPALAKGLNRPSNNAGWNRYGVRNLIDDARYYKGEYVAYKRATRKEDHEGKHVVVHVPAIIDEEMYQKVEYVRKSIHRLPIYTEFDPFTLARRITCQCGYTYAQQKTMRRSKTTGKDTQLYRYYRCTSQDRREYRQNDFCSIRTLNGDKVEAIVFNFISSLLTNPRATIARYKQEQSESMSALDNAIAHLESIDEVIAELDAEKEQVLKLYKKRLIDDDRAEADILAVERQKGKLAIERDKWLTIINQHGESESQIHKLEDIASAIRDRLDSLTGHEISALYDRLKLRIHAATEGEDTVLYVSILGCEPEKIVFGSDAAVCCE